jgi:hypothetical protein
VTTSNDPEQIRREIERTQAHLSSDVDALTEKATPGRIVERRIGRARAAVGSLKDRVIGSNDPGQQYNPYASSQGGRVQQAASSASDAASSAAATVSDTASSAAATLQEAPQNVIRQTQGNPLAAGLIAFGVGWLVSSLLPASRQEQQLAEQARNKASELGQPLAQVAAEVRDNLQEPAQQAVDSVKSTATEAGRTVADEGRSAAQDVQATTQDDAGTVKQNASNSR